MAIFGIGTDIVDIRRIEKSIEKQPQQFAQRILTKHEYVLFDQHYQHSTTLAAAYLAKRFAAKEAVSKAFGTGFSQGLSLQHIEVTNDDLGKPLLTFTQHAQALINKHNIKQTYLSLSDEKHYAVAYVILA